MHKHTGKLLVWGIILIIIGSITAGTVFAASGFNINTFDNSLPYEEKSINETLSDINSIEIDTKNQKVNITPSTDNTIQINYFENEQIYYTFTNESGIYKMKLTDSRKWYEKIIINFGLTNEQTLTVKIPLDYTGEIKVKDTNSNITLTNINVNSVSIENSNDDINLSNITVDNLSINNVNGNINLTDTTLKTVFVYNSNENINIKNMTATSLTAKNVNDKINFDNVNITTDAKLNNTNGEIILKNSTFGSIDCSTSNEEISVVNLISDSIVLNNKNADITGTIKGNMGDYKITSSVINGKNNLPTDKTDGTKTLTANTLNDDINISFID
jgi:DUF4097 and DUF4098 domain-containing protein YvlB